MGPALSARNSAAVRRPPLGMGSVAMKARHCSGRAARHAAVLATVVSLSACSAPDLTFADEVDDGQARDLDRPESGSDETRRPPDEASAQDAGDLDPDLAPGPSDVADAGDTLEETDAQDLGRDAIETGDPIRDAGDASKTSDSAPPRDVSARFDT